MTMVKARIPLVLTGLVVVLGIVFVCLSLVNAPGETVRGDGSCCNTEYVRGWWSLAPTLLFVPIFIIGRLSWRLMLVAVVLSGVAVWYIARTGVTRIEDAGWGDGLELLSYVLAAFQLMLFVAAGALGASQGRASRNAAGASAGKDGSPPR